MTPDEVTALVSLLNYAQDERGKSHGGYYSSGGWPYETLKGFVARHAPEQVERLEPSRLPVTHGTFEVPLP